MRELIFATNNKHKLEEVSRLLQGSVKVISLAEAGLEGEIPETAETLQGNALQKAQWVWERTGKDCFADDTGLEVDALGGAPGVYSARYAGEHCSFDDNIDKLLHALDGKVTGCILTERYWQEGFGYDPVFMPDRFAVSFAEMPLDVKNQISHRGLAVAELVKYLTAN